MQAALDVGALLKVAHVPLLKEEHLGLLHCLGRAGGSTRLGLDHKWLNSPLMAEFAAKARSHILEYMQVSHLPGLLRVVEEAQTRFLTGAGGGEAVQGQ